MVEMKAVYVGEKHCELTHGPSGTLIETDAPKDNQGRGEKFSPTDLMGAAYVSCALTTMAIVADREGIKFGKASGRVVKEMNASPRKIARLPLQITMPTGLSAEARTKLEAAAHNCPVAKSLAADIDKSIEFTYID